MKKYKTLKPVSEEQLTYRLECLIDDGYLKEVEETYYAGQTFIRDGLYWQIIKLGEKFNYSCFLVGIGNGLRYRNPVFIQDPKAITQAEFDDICGLAKGQFIPIKLKFVEVE